MDQIQVNKHNVAALLVLPFFCAIGFFGNLMVCVAIGMDRRLQNVTNYFLLSLAMADLLVCSIVMPLAILVEVQQGVWKWSFWLCFVYTYADVFLCSASIVHISVISLDRYLGISRPLKTRNKSRTVVAIKICFVWVGTIIISSPLAVLAFHDPSTILHDNVCTIRSQHYMIYGSILAFLIPFIIMTVTFTKTTQLLNKQASTLALKPVDGFNQGLRRTMASKKRTIKTRQIGGSSSASVNGTESVHATQRRGQRQGVLEISPLAKTSFTNGQDSINKASDSYKPDHEADPLIEKFEINNKADDEPYEQSRKTLSEKVQRRSTKITSQFHRLRNHLQIMRKKNEEITTSTELANEHKASRVLAVVFTCFFTCWTPFFIMNFTLGFCGTTCSVPPRIGSIILWLGYLSSTLNPVIYTIFNRRFREAFIKILKCKCLPSAVDNNYTRSQIYLATEPTWSCMDKSYQHKESVAALNGNTSLSTTTTLCVPNKNDFRKQRHRLRTQHSHDEATIQRRLSVDYPKTRRNSDTNSPQRTPSYIAYRS